MTPSLKPTLFRAYGRMPFRLRLASVRLMTPSFRVGAICVVERADGALLLVRHSYRRGWGFPGGLLKRGEAAIDAAAREALEEIGLMLELEDNPKVVVDPRYRRVDVIYSTKLPDGTDPAEARPSSAEILEVRWFPPDRLPRLGPEASGAVVELGRANRPPGPGNYPD
ncbi:MAG: NUDIX domain-containing protein [Actinomycetota bacterium]|nr:NUDIX domain-containing protein [Actinomycetota bacterium]